MTKPVPIDTYVRLAPLAWFAFVASAISQATGKLFLIVFPVVLIVVLAIGFLTLAWMVRWAKLRHSRPGQFGIVTLMLLIFYCAMFFGFVQWMLVNTPAPQVVTAADNLRFMNVATGCAVFTLISIPATLVLVEGAVWTGVRLTHWLAGTNISDSANSKLPGK